MVKLLTGNELLRGDVLWWDGKGWSLSIADAVALEPLEGAAILEREAVSERISDLALIDAEEVDGRFRPLKIRERIRGFGPTVRAGSGDRRAGLALMYQYDDIDQSVVDARVAEYRDQLERRLSGTLDEDHFKPLRLKNGLYLQLHAYMLRVAIPYGTLSGRQLRMLGHVARRYDRGYGHFTTRQNIQYNWIRLEESRDLLADLASVEMHAIQTSGNCIRNIERPICRRGRRRGG
jgi:hypothetical protein